MLAFGVRVAAEQKLRFRHCLGQSTRITEQLQLARGYRDRRKTSSWQFPCSLSSRQGLPRENQQIERRHASEGVKAPENSCLLPQGSASREAAVANRSFCSAATRTPKTAVCCHKAARRAKLPLPIGVSVPLLLGPPFLAGAPVQCADSDGSRPGFRDDLAHHSDLMSLGVPR
jgi:hypothetical protein